MGAAKARLRRSGVQGFSAATARADANRKTDGGSQGPVAEIRSSGIRCSIGESRGKQEDRWGQPVGTSSAGGSAQWTAYDGRRESAKGLALQVLDKSLDLTEIPIARRALEQCI